MRICHAKHRKKGKLYTKTPSMSQCKAVVKSVLISIMSVVSNGTLVSVLSVVPNQIIQAPLSNTDSSGTIGHHKICSIYCARRCLYSVSSIYDLWFIYASVYNKLSGTKIFGFRSNFIAITFIIIRSILAAQFSIKLIAFDYMKSY